MTILAKVINCFFSLQTIRNLKPQSVVRVPFFVVVFFLPPHSPFLNRTAQKSGLWCTKNKDLCIPRWDIKCCWSKERGT